MADSSPPNNMTSSKDTHTHHRPSSPTSTLSSPPASIIISSQRISPSTHHQRTTSTRILTLLTAVLAALCAGSITAFSLYGHIFQSRLHYTQYQVNGLAIVASFAMYIPCPLVGYVCDRFGPRPLYAGAGVLFGAGYGLAAGLYRRGASEAVPQLFAGVFGEAMGERQGEEMLEMVMMKKGPTGWEYALMIVAFIGIGGGTSAMYISSLSTVAKNFGKSKFRGLALVLPNAGFGLSGMWLSQLGDHVLYERFPDGQRGDVDVFQFFMFLAVVLFVLGLVGSFTMRVVDEEGIFEEAVEELGRSGLLEGSGLFEPGGERVVHGGGYGTMERGGPFDDDARRDAGIGHDDDDAVERTSLLDTNKTLVNDDEEAATIAAAAYTKTFILNAETRRFLTDSTMWIFGFGFFFATGPGEAFINNLGTVIESLNPPHTSQGGGDGTRASTATEISIVCVTSTLVRLLAGGLTDLLAPSPQTQHLQLPDPTASISSLPSQPPPPSSQSPPHNPFTLPNLKTLKIPPLSRVLFLIFFALLSSLAYFLLATGQIQNHGERFWLISALVGAGYGAVFSLTPLIITMIWGVENFATNFGIVAVFPAVGNMLWGFVYSAVYQAGAISGSGGGEGAGEGGGELFCHGAQCYAPTFGAMAVSVWLACGLMFWAWKGRNGWAQRGIVI